MDAAFSNQIEIKLIGLRRSGNHAVLNWVSSLFPGKVCFLNDIFHNPNIHSDQRTSELPGLAWNRRARLNEPKTLLLYNLEDHFTDECLNYWLPEELAGSSRQRLTILLLRDPYNALASRFQLINKLGDSVFADALRNPSAAPEGGFAALWKDHGRLFMSLYENASESVIGLNYNSWVADPSCRKAFCKLIGGNYSEVNLHQVPTYAFGSSFEGARTTQLADPVGLLRRWRHFSKDTEFLKILTDPEINTLASKIFGPMAESIQQQLKFSL